MGCISFDVKFNESIHLRKTDGVNKATSADTHDYSKAEELSRLFTLSDVVLHNGARKIASDPLTCELNAQAWAYGLALVPCQALLDNDTALIVECTLTVERGKVMVGGLHKNLAEYITPEFEVLEDRLAETTISIPISSPQGRVPPRCG